MSDIDIVQEVEKELSSEKPTTKKKRTTKSLTMSERMRIIDDFRNGIPDKYYSVSPHPRKSGEYIVRKRKNHSVMILKDLHIKELNLLMFPLMKALMNPLMKHQKYHLR